MPIKRLLRPIRNGLATTASSAVRKYSWRPILERLDERVLPSVSILNNGGNGYSGLSFNSSGGYVPPDTCGAAGPSVYVETVNQSLAIYNPKGTGASATTDSLSHFLFTTGGLTRADGGSGLSDPIVTYDEQIGRFIVGDQDVNFSTHVSAFDIAVSRTNNPTTLSAADWKFYKITTTESGFDADYPGNFGYNHDAFVFTLNMFGVTGGGHVQVVSANAADLMNAVASPQIVKNDLADFSVRPTTMHNSVAGDPMWLVTEHGDSHSIDVIKMTNVLGAASFAYTNLQVTAYSGAVFPRNPNNTVITNNMDSRILKSAEANNTIVAAHTVSISSTQDVVQWYAFNVSSGTPTLSQQGRVSAGANTYLYFPSIDINSSSQIGMTYMRSGTDTSSDFMSVWVTGRVSGDPSGTMQTPVIVPAGTGQTNYDDFTSGGRAGDLSGINVDPVDGTFWATNEFANTQATANWGTAIVNFSPGAVAGSADLAVVSSGPSSVTAGTNATYTITLTNNGPNAAQTVVLTDLLPNGSTFVSMTPGGSNPDSFTFGQSGNSVTESAATVGAGNTDTFTLVVFAPSNLPNGANFSNTASVSSSTNDPNSANNSSTTTGSIVNNGASADLSVANTGPATGNEGDTFTYTVTVTNNGPNDASGVVLTDTLAANFQYISATTSQGTFTQSGGVVTANLGTIANGGTATFTVTARALEDGNLTNSASATSNAGDPNSGNNSATATTAVAEAAINVSAPITTSTKHLTNVAVATFTHANGVEAPSAFTATIDWGDGRTSTGTITQSGTTYTVTGSHNYSRNGTHTISTSVVETGNDSDLLLGKIGDEEPELPDHHGAPPPRLGIVANGKGKPPADMLISLSGQDKNSLTGLRYLASNLLTSGSSHLSSAGLHSLLASSALRNSGLTEQTLKAMLQPRAQTGSVDIQLLDELFAKLTSVLA